MFCDWKRWSYRSKKILLLERQKAQWFDESFYQNGRYQGWLQKKIQKVIL